jgi:hypothetical protein
MRGLMIAGAVSLFFLIIDVSAFLTMAFMTLLGGAVLFIMFALRKPIKNDLHAALMSLGLTIVVPVNLCIEGWDDHDRGDRSIGLDMAKNYMNSCADNSIIFTHGDNDTFPLWYLQEVEGVKTSVRVYNLSLGQTDWYTEQMTMKVYDSEPLPIKFTKDQYAMFTGNMDNVYFLGSYLDLKSTPEISEELLQEIFTVKIENNREIFENNLRAATFQLASILNQSKIAEKNQATIQKLANVPERPGYEHFKYFMDLTMAVLQNGQSYELPMEQLEMIQKNATDL